MLGAFVVGIPRGGGKAHSDKKCFPRKIWGNVKLGVVVASEGEN